MSESSNSEFNSKQKKAIRSPSSCRSAKWTPGSKSSRSSNASTSSSQSPSSSGSGILTSATAPESSFRNTSTPSPPSSSGSGTTTLSQSSSDDQIDIEEEIMSKKSLQVLTKRVDINQELDEDVQDYVRSYADDFVEKLIEGACQIAVHRKGTTVEGNDLKMLMKRRYPDLLPGLGADNTSQSRVPRKRLVTEQHKQRLALIAKALKK